MNWLGFKVMRLDVNSQDLMAHRPRHTKQRLASNAQAQVFGVSFHILLTKGTAIGCSSQSRCFLRKITSWFSKNPNLWKIWKFYNFWIFLNEYLRWESEILWRCSLVYAKKLSFRLFMSLFKRYKALMFIFLHFC